jgi:heptosyltransferase-3
LLGHPKRAEILQNLPFVAEVGFITKHRARWRGWLPGRRWDLALVYGSDLALVAYALRAARRTVAFRQADAALNARVFRSVEPPPFQSLHSAKIPLLLTQALGLADAGFALSYAVTAAELSWARAELAPVLSSGATPLIGLQVASFPTKAYRDWPLEHFEALCTRIHAAYPRAHLLAFGGSLERRRTESLARRFASHATSFAGRLTLRQTAALMSMLDLYIGVDTGPTHIMGALRRPMIALYHCYSPSRLLAPLEHPCCYVVDHPRADQGCRPETPMAEISVEAVWAKVVEALAASTSAAKHAAT